MRKIIKSFLAAIVAVSVFAFAGSATAEEPICLDDDANEVACEKGPGDDPKSADGTGIDSADGTGIDSADGTGIDSADGTGIDSADGTGIDSADGTGIDSADGTGVKAAADPEGG